VKKILPDTMFTDPERSRLTMLRGWVLDHEVSEIEMTEKQFWNFAQLQPVAEKPNSPVMFFPTLIIGRETLPSGPHPLEVHEWVSRAKSTSHGEGRPYEGRPYKEAHREFRKVTRLPNGCASYHRGRCCSGKNPLRSPYAKF
jgi:hypothetical protein